MTPDADGLRTPRLQLRSLTAADIAGPYVDWLADPEVTRFLEVRFAPPDRDGLLAYVRRMNDSRTELLLGIFSSETRAHIGNIRLGPIDRHHLRTTIGIMIGDRSCWGRGYATEAIAKLSEFAFAEFALFKLTAGFYAPNERSVRAFEKAGFQVETIRHAHALFEGKRIDILEMARFRDAVA